MKRKKIAVYGDYDVDGVTATSLLTGFLRALGCDVTYYIPDRFKEGLRRKLHGASRSQAKAGGHCNLG